jgi:hypothetical protein
MFKGSSSLLLSEAYIWFKIILLSTFAACVIGIVNDMITVRICIEYFSKGFHYEMIKDESIGKYLLENTDKINLWAFFWGIIASWWVGAILGLLLALVSRVGRYSKLSMDRVFTNILICMGLIGLAMWHKFYNIQLEPIEEIRLILKSVNFQLGDKEVDSWSDEKCQNFMFNGHLHNAIYYYGAVFGCFTIASSIIQRFMNSYVY